MRVSVLTVVAMLGVGIVARAQDLPRLSVAEQYLFSAANAERAQRGLKPLRLDGALYRAADGHAREMAARESISHQYPGELELSARGGKAGARFSLIEENVALSPNAVRMHDAWMNSPGHRANLLNPQVDSVGIRVVSRRGELYGVEDFSRSVMEMTLEEQEAAVAAGVERVAGIAIVATPEVARRTCGMEQGYAGGRQPGFVMRYTAADLSKLPETLKERLERGRYREAAVGACSVSGSQNFTTYSIAVMLYP